MSRKEERLGKTGEKFAAQVLTNLGIEQLQRIGTPVKVIPVKVHGNKRPLFQVIWGEKVIGDYRGVLPGGRSVLAEVKTVLHRNLQYSDMRLHQPEGLTRHAELGGLSLLVWVHSDDEIYVMEWTKFGIPGFEPRHSLNPKDAKTYTNDLALKIQFKDDIIREVSQNHDRLCHL